jgi:hypothetical protein
MLYAVSRGFRVLIQEPLQTLHKFPRLTAGGLPRLLRTQRQWNFLDQPMDAIHPLEDLAKPDGFPRADDRSLALAFVNSGAQEIDWRAAAGNARGVTDSASTISLRASIDDACSGRWWGRISFSLGKKLLCFLPGAYGGPMPRSRMDCDSMSARFGVAIGNEITTTLA